jgi:Asp/Glu/hydantoin racemase
MSAGHRDRHDAILGATIRRLQHEVDVIVLAQASMAHLAPVLAGEISVPLLASPEPVMQDIERRLASLHDKAAARPS